MGWVSGMEISKRWTSAYLFTFLEDNLESQNCKGFEKHIICGCIKGIKNFWIYFLSCLYEPTLIMKY